LKGGLINFAEGRVGCVCKGMVQTELRTRSELQNGDTLETGPDGRAEFLLSPGYYLRLFNNTHVTIIDLSRDNMKLKVGQGSVILEVVVNETLRIYYVPEEVRRGLYDLVTIVTPQGEVAATKGGIYRVNVRPNGATELHVLKGAAIVGGRTIKDKQGATIQIGSAILQKSAKATDAFDDWSRSRGLQLVKANKAAKESEWHKKLRSSRASHINIVDNERADTAKERLTISALGGLVTFVEPGATYKRGSAEWMSLKEDDHLEFGDRIHIGKDSRAEIRIFPDCYLHISGDTEFIYLRRRDGVDIELLRGSAIVHNWLDVKDQNLVTLSAPHGLYNMLTQGLYRLNVDSKGDSEMLVYSGYVQTDEGELIEQHHSVEKRNGAKANKPIDKRARDAFDIWSEKRISVQGRRLPFTGVWFLEENSGEYTFIPVAGYKSPYGGDYSTTFMHRASKGPPRR
jgi:hypothetical protein